MTAWLRPEEGQTTILIIGYVTIALLAISAMLAATGVNLEARRLQSLADSTADAAAHGFHAVTPALDQRLTHGTVRERASDFLDRTNAGGRFTDFALAAAHASPDGGTAHVRLTASAAPPIVGWITPWRVPIHAEGDARTTTRQ